MEVKNFLTFEDVIKSGACYDGVINACIKAGVFAGYVDDLLKLFGDNFYFLRASNLIANGYGNGYGDGCSDGYGYGNGYGESDGYGYGKGYGYGTGNGYGDGSGNGYGNGNCNGDGGSFLAANEVIPL